MYINGWWIHVYPIENIRKLQKYHFSLIIQKFWIVNIVHTVVSWDEICLRRLFYSWSAARLEPWILWRPSLYQYNLERELWIESITTMQELDMCLWNTDAPGSNKVKYGKNLQVLHFDPTPPQGYVMSVKCEEPIDELTVQVWLLYHHPNFKYCTLLVSGTELRTDRRTDNTRCPRRTFQAGGIKMEE